MAIPTSCPICSHPQRAEIEKALIERTITISDIKSALKMAEVEVKIHLTRHLINAVDLPPALSLNAKDLANIDNANAFTNPSAVVDTSSTPTLAGDTTVSTLKRQLNTHDILFNNLQGLGDRLGMFITSSDYGPATTKQIIMLAQEVRKTIMDLAVLEGKIHVQQSVTINQYNTLKAVLFSGLCPMCRSAIMKQMSAMTTDQSPVDAEYTEGPPSRGTP